VVDGPRTDVNDLTTYAYYPEDAVCAASTASSIVTNLGCRGQLQSITNALGHITRYDRYNHHGQVEQITAANGLTTTYTYDARQRLLTHTVGALTTTLTYDGVGQITRLDMPDGSLLNYTYDAAHRLTRIQDTLGNAVAYTLDAEGNRTREDTYDPLGNLAKTLTRSYDALNRLQTINGIAQ
jgi:YD repeat-containing protein